MHDPDMCGDPTGASISAQNAAVNQERVEKNMDLMAMELTGKATADDAWKTIFRSSKPWDSTKVMIKVNCVERNMMARVAVIKKIVDLLIGFGVQPANIVLFDGQGGDWAQYQSFMSLTDNTKIRAVLSNKYDSLGGEAPVAIPSISGGSGPKDLVDGVTDIIVNIAVNKGHDSPFNVGKLTLCLKNHFGTFLKQDRMFGLAAVHLHSNAGLMNSNKIAAIVGGDPVRQQLCIIDTLWAMKGGPSGNITHKPDRLIMGTFAGAVDYCCAKKIREELMKVTNHEAGVIPKFLTEFGYKETDPVWVEITPTGTTVGKVTGTKGTERFTFILSGGGLRESTIHFALPRGNGEPVTARIYDMRGVLVRALRVRPQAKSIMWDGRSSHGTAVPGGSFVVEVSAGKYRISERITVLR